MLNIVGTLLILCTALNGQSHPLAKTIKDYATENNFNGTVLISENDSIIFSDNFGYANREFNIPIDSTTKFKIASITKLFTSVLILQLHEKGKIDINKSINTYLPDYKGEADDKVTIYHLLTETSGLEDMEKNGDIVYEKRFTTDDILSDYCSGKLVNEPGTKFFYNNADYVILGKIIEKIYNTSFSNALKTNILEPLTMNNTGILNYSVVEGLADCYWYNNNTKNIERDIPYYPENYFSSGAMYSTAHDLMNFSNALFSGKLIKKSTLSILLKPKLEKHACGLWVFDYWINDSLQYKTALRTGNIWGAEAVLIRVIEKDINVIILSNMMGTADMGKFHYNILKAIEN